MSENESNRSIWPDLAFPVALSIAAWAIVALAIVDRATATAEAIGSAEVIERAFTPASSSFGVGTSSIDGSAVVTHHHAAEQWTLIVRLGDEIVSIATDADTWAATAPGDLVTVGRLRGGLLGNLVGDYRILAEEPSPTLTKRADR